jgi:hypothetical protein
MKMIKMLLFNAAFIAVFFIAVQIAAAQEGPSLRQAVLKEFKGTVEIKTVGGWEKAYAGMELPRDALISTGFNSEAVVTIGRSEVTLRPLTRIGLEEISGVSGSNVGLSLRTGRVKARVEAPSGIDVDFTVRGPSIVASVRGTEF